MGPLFSDPPPPRPPLKRKRVLATPLILSVLTQLLLRSPLELQAVVTAKRCCVRFSRRT